MKNKLWMGLFIGLCSTSFNVSAQDQYYDFGIIGLGTGLSQSVFSEENEVNLNIGPSVFYNGKHGFINGNLINISVVPYVGITGQWRFAEVSDDNISLPDGIDDRDGNGELGFTIGTVGARLTYLQDMSDEHDGYELQLHLARTFNAFVDGFTLTPYVEIDYRDDNFSQHLYGISATESVNSGLNQFEADNSFVYKTGLISLYPITPEWLLIAKVDVEHHDSESELVQRDLGGSINLGITYKFTD